MPAEDSTTATQVCTKCGVEKPLAGYSVRKNGIPYRQCKACAAERTRQWVADNPERYRTAQRERRLANLERYAAYSRKWDAKHPEQRKALNATYSASPAGKRGARATARRAFDRKREWLDSFKVGQPCADCQIHWPPFVLDFDHVRGEKAFTIGNWMAGKVNVSEAVVIAEIAKCELRCANCHRIRHADQLRPARNPSENWNDGQMGLAL